MLEICKGLLVPFLGTSIGAACVFLMKNRINDLLEDILAGFAGGVMLAASVWSLLLPAIEQAEDMGTFAFIPAVAGFWIGVIFLLLLDVAAPHMRLSSEKSEGG